MKSNLIIFSKNRACQLQLLLESLEEKGKRFFNETRVLFKAGESYAESYKILRHRFPNVKFKIEKDFRADLLSMLKKEGFTTFLVDDTILYSRIERPKDEILNLITEDVVCFSLRLGLNCKYSHPADIHYSIASHASNEHYLKFNWATQQPGDFRYPMSVDGHIFKANLIKKIIERSSFTNPNTLESTLQNHLNSIPQNIVCFKHSKLVGIPVNLVNTTHQNKSGLTFHHSAESLNLRYLKGESIDLKSIDVSKIIGPHQEIEYKFKKHSNERG